MCGLCLWPVAVCTYQENKTAVDGGIAHDAQRCANAPSDVFVTQRQICVSYMCRSSPAGASTATSAATVGDNELELQGWAARSGIFSSIKHFCGLKSSQACSPAPVDGVRAQDRPFSCISASVPFRGPEVDPRSIRGRSEMTEIVTISSGDLVQQDVTS